MNAMSRRAEEAVREGGSSPTRDVRSRRVEIVPALEGWTARIRGPFDGAAVQELRGLLPDASLEGRLLLDCRRAEYATAAGLRAVLDLALRLRSRGGSLALLSSPGAWRDLVALSGIARLPGVAALPDSPEPRRSAEARP